MQGFYHGVTISFRRAFARQMKKDKGRVFPDLPDNKAFVGGEWVYTLRVHKCSRAWGVCVTLGCPLSHLPTHNL